MQFNMRLIRILMMLMILFPLGIKAQRTDVIVTRDGNKYEGYLAEQVPNKSVTIVSSRTTITVSSKDAELTRLTKKMLGDLSDEVIALFPLLPDEAYVESADIIVEDLDGREVVFRNSVILEKGEYLKFVSFEPQMFELEWSRLKTSSKTPYDFSKNVGVRDRLLLPNARLLEGQQMEYDLRSDMLKFRDIDGGVTNFHKSQVLSIRYEQADPEADIWEQIPYCDRVNLKDGSSRQGFIISKVFGVSVEIRLFNSSIEETIKVKDIKSYEKYKNPFFQQKYEIPEFVERSADLYVNGETRFVSELFKEKRSYSVSSEVDSLKTRVNAGERVVIKYRAEARTSLFRFAKAKLAQEKVYKVRGLKVKDKGLEQHPVFSESDVISNPDINFQANEGGYITADFVLEAPGIYVFFIKDSNRCFVIYAQ